MNWLLFECAQSAERVSGRVHVRWPDKPQVSIIGKFQLVWVNPFAASAELPQGDPPLDDSGVQIARRNVVHDPVTFSVQLPVKLELCPERVTRLISAGNR